MESKSCVGPSDSRNKITARALDLRPVQKNLCSICSALCLVYLVHAERHCPDTGPSHGNITVLMARQNAKVPE